MTNKIANPQAVAWVMAAEGYISLVSATLRSGTPYYTPIVQVTNTDKEFIEKFWELAGFYGYIIKKAYQRGNPNHKPLYRWQINKREEVAQFLVEILPYLPIKVLQTKLVLEFLGTGGCRIDDPELVSQIRMLNRRGW